MRVHDEQFIVGWWGLEACVVEVGCRKSVIDLCLPNDAPRALARVPERSRAFESLNSVEGSGQSIAVLQSSHGVVPDVVSIVYRCLPGAVPRIFSRATMS